MKVEPSAEAPFSIAGAWHLVPEHIRARLDAHIGRGEVVGSFLTAVLQNDLREAVCRADDVNGPRLRDIVVFLVNDAPCSCWGSLAKVEAWRERGGLAGRAERGIAPLDFEGRMGARP